MLSILPPDFFIVGQSQTRFQPESVASHHENALSGENGCLGKEVSCGLLVALVAALDNGQLLHPYLPQPSPNRAVTMLVPLQADPVLGRVPIGFCQEEKPGYQKLEATSPQGSPELKRIVAEISPS